MSHIKRPVWLTERQVDTLLGFIREFSVDWRKHAGNSNGTSIDIALLQVLQNYKEENGKK